MKLFPAFLLAVLVTLATTQGGPLRLTDDRAWLTVENESLTAVLTQFADYGVEVLLDPNLNQVRVSGCWIDSPVEQMLDQLVNPHNYALEWIELAGQMGPYRKIHSIRVFSDKGYGQSLPLKTTERILDVVDGKYIRNEIMVGFNSDATPADLKELLRQLNGTVMEAINPPGIYRIRMGSGLSVPAALALIATHPNIAAAEPNYVFPRIKPGPTLPLFDGSTPRLQLNLPEGANLVAVFDSGIDPQYIDGALIAGGYNALDPNAPISDPGGHGTLMALIASGAVTPDGAPASESGVPVLAIKTFDENGNTSSDILLRAFNQAAAEGVKVVNMSWGSETDSQFMQMAMDAASQYGIELVAAAGNTPSGTPIYPSAYDSVTCVGGLQADGSPWPQSNYGDFVDQSSYVSAQFNGQTSMGTSISSAYVAGQKARANQ